MRKLVTIRAIDEINPIDGADAIEVAVFGGWTVVIKKNEFKVGDKVLYFEIDSFLPEGNPAWQFLVDKSARIFEGRNGHRLRTIKLRGQISQGLVLPLSALPEGTELDMEADFAEVLGIVKWEQPLPAELAGQAEGLFPGFIRKTDQERCQNIVDEIFQYDDRKVLIDGLAPEQADQAAILGGRLLIEDGKVYSVRLAKADPNALYEVSTKMDGSSMTVFARAAEPSILINGFNTQIESGVCSRNLQLKVNDANAENTFVKLATESGLLRALEQLAGEGKGNVAVQGELMGPGIQGNRENLKTHQLFIFDVQFLDAGGGYLTNMERNTFFRALYDRGVNPELVKHVPVLYEAVTLQELGITNVKELLAFAEGPSLNHPVREGLVFKRIDGKFSFKAISNAYLAKEKD